MPGFHRSSAVSSLSLFALSPLTFAVSVAAAQPSAIDEIVIVGQSQIVENRVVLEGDALRVANTEDFLRAVPGANLNRNGPITALPQYRGASGDRVSVVVNGQPMIAGGPNAMDAPLSVIPGANLETLSVSRGIASVSAAQESLGGHVSVVSRQGDFTDHGELRAHLQSNALYSSNADGVHASALGYLANDSHKAGLTWSWQEGDDQDFAGGEIPNTYFERDRLAGFYGYRGERGGFHVDVSRTNTDDTGTAALPMDILFIDSETLHANAYLQLGDWELQASLGSQDVDHGMDNYSYRPAPSMNMHGMSMPMARHSLARGEHEHASLSLSRDLSTGSLIIGSDYSRAWHDAQITDPDNAAFFLYNFSNVEKDITGYFVEWVHSGTLSWELGLRRNRWQSDADAVRAAGAPPMMAANMMPLAMAFNSADRKRRDHNTDVVAKLAYDLSPQATLSAGIARKSRAPSYQELYLWAPLETSGGLADGRNYMGNLELGSEVAHELNLGLDLYGERSNISLQVFYRQVDDYIQGIGDVVSPWAAQANMASMAMGGMPALQFNNVEAELYGVDIGYHGELGERFYYRGNLSYVRGKRDDIDDNLYRIAPLNHSLIVGARVGDWDLSFTSELAARQDKVSRYNNEGETAGYGLLHLNARWQSNDNLQLVLGVDNVFDKDHRIHLNGYNRVSGADVLVGERLPGQGRSVRLGFSYVY